jgi:hypothetical protein
MRTWSLLLVAFGIVLYAIHLIATAESFAPYVLRDGGIVAALGLLLFVLQAPPPVVSGQARTQRASILLLLGVVVVLAAFVRLWRLTQLPPDCIDAECDRALALTAGNVTPTLFTTLARLLFTLTDQPLWSLRLSSALWGWLTIPVFFMAAQRWARPDSALLATMLLAFSPWHLWASRTTDPWITLPLLICLLLWIVAIPTRRSPFAIVSLLIFAALILWLGWQEVHSLTWQLSNPEVAGLLATLLHRGSAERYLIGQPLLGVLPAALALVGIGYAVRYGWYLRLAGLLIGFGVLLALLIRIDDTLTSAASFLLPTLPFLSLFAALAFDPLLALNQQIWHGLIRPSRLVMAACLLVFLSAGRASLAVLGQLDSVRTGGASPGEAALGRFLAQQVTASAVTIYAPTAVIESPATRLLAGSALTNGQVRPLEHAFDDLVNGASQGDLLYLVPSEATNRLDVLRVFYPNGDLQSQTDETDGTLLFYTLAVSAQENAARQGLPGMLLLDNGVSMPLPATDQLRFDWQAQQPLTTTLQAHWQGDLIIPVAGNYRFAVQGVDNAAAFFALRLDNTPVLDTAQGFTEQSITLAQGFYHIDMRYTHSQATPLTIQWQPPDGDWAIIPRRALRNPPAPTIGLVATYYAGTQWQGDLLDQRKDLVLEPALDLPTPYSVRWQGQVAAPRSGDYLFATLADGVTQIRIDGQLLVDGQPPAEADTAYTEGLIYLQRGWHPIELRYAPAGEQPMLQLWWQPAGGGAIPLNSVYFAPLVLSGNAAEQPLPLAPPLLDPSLGDEYFALAQARESWQPQARIPPANLPPLPFHLLWQAGNGCGVGADQLNQPHGVAISAVNDRIYVADTANLRVMAFTFNGTPMGSIRHAAFQEPFDLQLGMDGAPLLLDAVAQQIFRIDPAANVAEPVTLAASFYRPRGLAIDPAGNFMVADTGGARIALLQANGDPLGEYGGPETPLGKGQPVDALWNGGRLWAVTAEDGRLWRLDNGGSLMAVQPTNTLNGPHLAGLPNGSLLVSDPERGLVLYHAASGEPRGQLAQPGIWVTPTGVDALFLGEQVFLAVVDSETCLVSFWQAPATALP